MATLVEKLREDGAALAIDAADAIVEMSAVLFERQAEIATLRAQIESDAKVIAEKDTEIRSMIAVHNSDVDGMRMQEEKIADQKKVIAALREALYECANLARGWTDRIAEAPDYLETIYQVACQATGEEAKPLSNEQIAGEKL